MTSEEDFKWLISAQAKPLLDGVQQEFENKVNVVRIAKRLRKEITPNRAGMIMEQAQLRIRGRKKFALADQMFFTRSGLEQSTSQKIAAYKASRFEGIANVADLCCGIGGDLIGLAGRQGAEKTYGLDADRLTCLFASHNLRINAGQFKHDSSVIMGQVEEFDWENWEGVHCDPDRRTPDRTIIGNRFSPPLFTLFSRMQPGQNLAIKIAPATRSSQDWPSDLEREWIGDRRECKQQVLWLGPKFKRPGQESGPVRTATMVDDERLVQFTAEEVDLDITVEVSGKIGRYLYEPHPTILAAGMTNLLATRGGLARIEPDVDYLTSTQPMKSPLITRYEVIDAFPLSTRRTQEFLKGHQIGKIEVKSRGANQVYFQQFQKMNLQGPYRATVVLTRIGLQQYVAICRRTPQDFPI